MQIKRLDALSIDLGGAVAAGFNQAWFPHRMGRMGGCGATAAAMQLCYLTPLHPALALSCGSKREAVASMEALYRHITPGWMGVDTTAKFCRGAESFLRERGVTDLQPIDFVVPKEQPRDRDAALSFIEEALGRDCPVAFLNLHSGRTGLDSHHWSLIVGLSRDITTGHAYASCFDSGESFVFDLDLWLATSKKGGGFVVFAEREDATAGAAEQPGG